MRRLAETEGILLEPVDTGTAMAALSDLVRDACRRVCASSYSG